jgi:hypothetical protein
MAAKNFKAIPKIWEEAHDNNDAPGSINPLTIR